jgi:aminopeptidase N
MNNHENPQKVFLKDYQQTPFSIETVDLHFDLHDTHTDVTTLLKMNRRDNNTSPLVLVGDGLELLKISMNGKDLATSEYTASANELRIEKCPNSFDLITTVRILPHLNKSLMGLYKSDALFCTQCEAEGFRKITYFYDRPDVMSIFTATIAADKTKFPVLLANGNFVEKGELPENRHFVKWLDPFKKPSYLFALVAGNLSCLRDTHTTTSGRKVDLEIFAVEKDMPKCHHAMTSLKQSMKWDEDVYGRECDLDNYKIVAVNDFNFGAMENKGLNIFNVSAVLANSEMAPDGSFERVQGVVAHEYFHNWTGNRVTCREWFQLCLKEGLTCFRDQEFSADLNSRPVKRIADVVHLRAAQFQEDSGPMAHPARPESFIDITNFYTVTVYEKGAELCRMMRTLLGPQGFRKGTDLYFERHDGQAVTVEDFVKALADGSGKDLTQFMQWYRQAGTPIVKIDRTYNAANKTFTLKVSQHTPPTPDGSEKKPLHMPMLTSLITRDGKEVPLRLRGEKSALGSERVLELTQPTHEFIFEDVHSEPVPSVFRSFSAPVHVEANLSDEELLFLLANETDAFNRWDAGQRILTTKLLALASDAHQGKTLKIDDSVLDALFATVQNPKLDNSFKALMLSLPGLDELSQKQTEICMSSLHKAHNFVREKFAHRFHSQMAEMYLALKESGPYIFSAEAVGRRSLKNSLLDFLSLTNEARYLDLAVAQYRSATNMTDERAAISILASTNAPERAEIISDYYKRWKHEPLVLDSWFRLQAAANRPNVLADVQMLLKHPDFNITNPNRARSIFMTLCVLNQPAFHAPNGEGYRIIVDGVIAADAHNPNLSSRIAREFSQWKRLEPKQKELCKKELERLAAQKLTKELFEIVQNLLTK